MGRKKADPVGHGQMTLYSGCRKKCDELKRLAEDRDTRRKLTH